MMKPAIKKHIRVILEEENRVMSDALNNNTANKQIIQNMLQRNKDVLTRLDKDCLSQEDLQLIRDANDIYLNDHESLADHYEEIVGLDRWLDTMTEQKAASKNKTSAITEKERCLKCDSKVAPAGATDERCPASGTSQECLSTQNVMN